MDSRKTYFDKLNAGRERRANSTLDDISETLSSLERQLDAARGQRAPAPEFRRTPAADTLPRQTV